MTGRVSPIVSNLPYWLLFAGLAAAGAMTGAWLHKRSRRDPAEKERRRRLALDRDGRMAEAMITDADENTLHYTYNIRGVIYTTSQDVSTLRNLLPQDPTVLIGHAVMKYSQKNPANSILLCENWSGLRGWNQNSTEKKEPENESN